MKVFLILFFLVLLHLYVLPTNTTKQNLLANTPIILRSIEFLDIERFYEVGDLLSDIASGVATEIMIDEELKMAVGNTQRILYVDKDNQIVIYDLDKGILPGKKKHETREIKERCLREIEKGINPTIQKMYDEMVYQALSFNMAEPGKGYALTKKRENER